MQINLKYYIGVICLTLLCACKNDNIKNLKPIALNDANTIVTETDSAFLKNVIEDITPKKNKNADQGITASLQQIDLDKKQDALQAQTVVDNTAKGTKIILADGVEAVVGLQGVVSKNGNKFILKSNNNTENVQIKISGLENGLVEQRIFTNLAISIAGADYYLNELPVSTGAWATLPGKNNLFISLAKSAYSYSNINHQKIALATDRELRKAGKGRIELENAAKEIANTNSANDAPCKIIFNSCQWKISGLLAGKPFEKIIQLETN